MEEYHRGNMRTFEELCTYYHNEQTRRNEYYESEMEELRDEIRRQYKVIALMKQEVEDLMILIKEQRLEEDISDVRQSSVKEEEEDGSF